MDRKLTLAIILLILGLAYKALPNGALDPEGGKSKRSEGSFTYHRSDAKDFQEFLLRLEKLGLIKNPGRFRNWDDEELRGFSSGSGDGSGEGSGDCGPYDSQDCLGSENGSGKCGPIDSEDCEGSGDGSGSYVSESSEDQGSRTEGSAGPLPTSSDDEDFYYALKGLVDFAETLGIALQGTDATRGASLDEACSMDRNCELKDEYSRCGDENTCVCKDGYRKQVFPQVGSYCTVYVPVPPTPPVIDPKAPCSFPYVEIAYKMCILPELEQRLTWVDAVDYCRALGLELAYDSVVIKARRYFNDLLGESGTRERWPIWIGGKQETNEAGESHWVWTDGTSVPSFLWQEGKPRTWVDTYSGGLCMIMDGYAQYYPDSLPCHYKRRFVCQRLS